MASSDGLSSSGTSSRGDPSTLLLPSLPAAFELALPTPAAPVFALPRSPVGFTAAAAPGWLDADPCLAGGCTDMGALLRSCCCGCCCRLCGGLVVALPRAASTLAGLG